MERQDPQLDADRYRVTQPGAGAPGHRRRTGKTGGLNDLRGDRFLDNYRGFGGMFLGAGKLTSGIATVLANVQPLIAAVLAYWYLKEVLSRRMLAGLLIGFVG